MKGIRVGRWLLGGIAAGVLIWLSEGAASVLYVEDMEAAMAAHNLAWDMGPATFVISLLMSILLGLAITFFYVAGRPRFGPGPRTAAFMAVAFWFGGYVPSLFGYYIMGLFPGGMLALWGAVSLVEMVLAGLLGAWIYREA